MPTVLRIGPYRFFFYSREGTEPPHIHIAAAEKVAKYWLEPVSLAMNDRFRSGELAELEALTIEHQRLFLETWHAYFKR